MDVLKGLFGSITSSILQLLVIAGTLALVYVFAIKPALDTTIEVSEQFSGGRDNGSRSVEQTIQQQIRSVNQSVQRQVNRSFQQTTRPGGTDPQALLRCVKRADQSARKLQACARRF